MAKIVLLVHHRFCQTVLTSQLSKKGLEVCSFKLPEVDQPSEAWMEKLTQDAIEFLKDHADVAGVIVESNYGYPAFEGVNQNLLDYINENYSDKVKKIVYSGTAPSLQKALERFPKMFGVFNGLDEPGFQHEKMIARSGLVEFLKPKKRSRSMVIPYKTKSQSSITPSASSYGDEHSIAKCFSMSPRDYTPSFNAGESSCSSAPSVDEVAEKLKEVSLAEQSFSP